jgi:hypothetical protein
VEQGFETILEGRPVNYETALHYHFEQWWEANYEGLDGLDDQDKAFIAVKHFLEANTPQPPGVLITETQEWPISRIKDEGGDGSDNDAWEFVQMTESCTYFQAMTIAGALQRQNVQYQYRIWDCR